MVCPLLPKSNGMNPSSGIKHGEKHTEHTPCELPSGRKFGHSTCYASALLLVLPAARISEEIVRVVHRSRRVLRRLSWRQPLMR